MRTCPWPGSPTCTSSSCSTWGPPWRWWPTALAIFLLLGLFSRLHSLQRGLLHFKALDRETDHVQVHVEPRLERAQLADALLELLRVEGRHRHAGQRHVERAPQPAEHLEGVLRRRRRGRRCLVRHTLFPRAD